MTSELAPSSTVSAMCRPLPGRPVIGSSGSGWRVPTAGGSSPAGDTDGVGEVGAGGVGVGGVEGVISAAGTGEAQPDRVVAVRAPTVPAASIARKSRRSMPGI